MPGFTIDRHTLDELQFHVMLETLQGYAFTSEGREYYEHPEYSTDAHQLEYARDVTAEILGVFSVKPTVGVRKTPGITDALVRARKPGAVLSGEQLWDIFSYVQTVSALKRQFLNPDARQPLLAGLLEAIPDLSALLEALGEYLEYPGSVREDHPRIRRLNDALRSQKDERNRLIGRLIGQGGDSMQSNIAAVRDGRLVLPVKSHDKNRMPGIMHASSQTGNTLFIEPFELVDKNNAVSVAEQEVHLEIGRILAELTEKTAEHLEFLEQMQTAAARFDRFYAAACYAGEHACTRPETSASAFVLRQARHPLLKKKAVPVDIVIDEQVRVMVMSGPNAGGKTVTIKTVGFFVLMNQLGLYLPAAEGIRMPVFTSLWSDIGDEQSIELELSTFSGHLKRISSILQHADDHALILLDELGTGTDPIEGAALAQAILEHCLNHAALTLVTSHHAVLKQFAYATDHVTNASMAFDETTHEPTFKVVFGHPGESRAVDTAKRLGFPEHIITEAQNLLGNDMLDVSKMMQNLQLREQQLAGAEADMASRRKELSERSRALDLERLRLKQEKMIVKRQDMSALQRFIRESRSKLEQTVRELRESGGPSKQQIRKAHQVVEDFEKRQSEEEQRIETADEALPDEAEHELSQGDRVSVISSRQKGRIIRAEKRDSFLVELENGMRVTLPSSQLKRRQEEKSSGKRVQVVVDDYGQRAVSVVDIRGLTLSEALEVIERQIDAALLSGLANFSIIHGKGEGILQAGVRDFLSHHKDIQSFSYARPEDGGYGKTLVEL
jgi:DNA mismatch repair protein MutS2